jgi:hypothetical protein
MGSSNPSHGFIAHSWQLRKKMTAAAGFLTHLLGYSGRKYPLLAALKLHINQ